MPCRSTVLSVVDKAENDFLYEKLSKKEKRKLDLARRQTWGEMNPITRKPEISKAYNRRKSQNWKRDLPSQSCDFSYFAA